MQRYLAKIEGAPQLDKWKLHKARTVVGWFSKGIPHGKDIRTGLQDGARMQVLEGLKAGDKVLLAPPPADAASAAASAAASV